MRPFSLNRTSVCRSLPARELLQQWSRPVGDDLVHRDRHRRALNPGHRENQSGHAIQVVCIGCHHSDQQIGHT